MGTVFWVFVAALAAGVVYSVGAVMAVGLQSLRGDEEAKRREFYDWLALLGDDDAPPPPQSVVRANALRDPAYCPYCMRCKGLHRMRKRAPMRWECDMCGAEHEEALPTTEEVAYWNKRRAAE